MPSKRRYLRCRGFSLPELTIVVLIISIVAVAAIPHYGRSISQFRAEAAAKRVAADLMYARQTAMNQGVAKQVTFSTLTNTYSMPTVPNPDRSSLPYSVNLTTTAYPAKITAANFAGTSIVTFDRFGQPNTAGFVTVKSNEFQKSVTLNAVTGRAIVQ